MNRQIDTETEAFISARIFGCNQTLAGFFPADLTILAGIAMTGIGETGGDNRGLWVERILHTVGLFPGNPWCMALIQTLVAYAEKITGQKSALAAGGHVLTVLSDSQKCLVPSPSLVVPGDLICFQHGDTLKGHVEIVTHNFQNRIVSTIGGNTSSGIGVNRDGDGVFAQMRPMTGSLGRMHVRGFLRPFPLV